MADSAQTRALVERTAREYGRIDVLVHAAGVCPRRPFLADILDSEQDGAVMVAGAENLAGIDQHGAPANGRKVVLDFESLN